MSLTRYSRQMVLPEVGVAGQTVLRDSTALIVGLGGLGSPAALYLAGAGVGQLILADFDRVAQSNLHRQTLYREADVGQKKTAAAIASIQRLNPQVECLALDAGSDDPAFAQAVASADVVLDCSDNFPSRFAVNAACIAARKPLVSGAAIRWEGQVAAFDLRAGGPCYGCLYPRAGEAAEACEDSGILGPVAGVIGAQQALIALQILLGQQDVASVLHTWDARHGLWRRLQLRQDPSCPYCASAPSSP